MLTPGPPADTPVVMSPYIVKALPDHTLQEVKEAVAQHERLKSPALLHVGDKIDVLLPPKVEMSRAGDPRLNVGILQFRF